MPATSAVDRGGEPSVLVTVVDGLIDRAQRSPLMRRAPAQCTAEEQATLAQVLADLAALRRLRASLETQPPLRFDQVAAYWPELSGLLAPARRGAATNRARPRDMPSDVEPASLFDAAPPEPAPDPAPLQDPVTPSSDEQSDPASQAAPDLAPLLVEALTGQGRALNTTQLLAWLAERGAKATREQITDTLFRHEDLFRRRGTSQWVAATRE